MLVITCPAPFAVINYELTCFLTLLSVGKLFRVSVDYGQGDIQYFSLKDDIIVVIKVYQQVSNTSIIAKIESENLVSLYSIQGKKNYFVY